MVDRFLPNALALLAFILLTTATVASGQEVPAPGQPDSPPPPASQPVTAPAAAGGERLVVIVQEVTGLVQVRENRDVPWKKAAVGMELGEGAEFRTGPRSAVVCTIPPDQTIVLDRLGTVTVAEAVRRGGTTRTDLVMKYGRTEYEIEAAGAKHDATIRSPSSTLAVRGTRVNLYDQPPFTPEARSFTGRAVYQYAKRQTALGGPGRGARVRADRGTAAESALGETVVDPAIAAARTDAERALIASEVSRGGLERFDGRAGIDVVRNRPPLADDQLAANLPGRLNFVLRWTGQADVNLAVTNTMETSPGVNAVRELIYPGLGLERSPAGGQTAFDHRGGPVGGQELVFYPDSFNPGQYTAQALFTSGSPTDFTLNAFLDGRPLSFSRLQFDEQGNVVTEPFTLPNGDVIQLPVLISEEVVRGRLDRDNPATPLLPEDSQVAVVDLRDVPPARPASAAPARAPRAAGGRPAAAAPGRADRRAAAARAADARALEKQQNADARRRVILERRQAKQLLRAERRAAIQTRAAAAAKASHKPG